MAEPEQLGYGCLYIYIGKRGCIDAGGSLDDLLDVVVAEADLVRDFLNGQAAQPDELLQVVQSEPLFGLSR